MAKNVGTLAILSENASLLSENCCSCKYFGTPVFILFIYIFLYLFIFNTKKLRRKVKTDTITHRTQINALDKITGTLNLIFGSTPLEKNYWNQSLPVTMNEVSYSAMGCKPLDDIAHSGHRDIKISGDGLVALRLSMFFHIFLNLKSTENSLHFFRFSMLSVTHNTKIESTFLHFNWLQVWLILSTPFYLPQGV